MKGIILAAGAGTRLYPFIIHDYDNFVKLLGDGSQWGIYIDYEIQYI